MKRFRTVSGLSVFMAVSAMLVFSLGGSLSGCRPSPTPSPPSPPVKDLAGIWYGEPVHHGQTGRFAIRLTSGEDDAMQVFLSLPDLDVFDLPAGKAKLEGNRLQTGFMSLEYVADREALIGMMPASLVPIYEIPMELRRVPALEQAADTGAQLPEREPSWSFATGAAIWAGLTFSEGVVFVGSDDGQVYALNARSGTELWRFATQGPIRARPTVVGSSVLIHSDDGFLYRLEAATGKLTWNSKIAEPLERIEFGGKGFRYDHYASSASVADDIIYIGHADGSLHALSADTGKRVWKFQAGDAVTSTPLIHEGKVFIGSFDNRILAVDATSGSLVWEHDTGAPVPSSPALHDGLVIVGSRSYDLLALNTSDGIPRWSHYFWFSWIESSATVRDGKAYVGSSDAQLIQAFDAADGRLLWKFDTGGSPWAQPAVSETAVYLGSAGVADYMVDHQGGFFAIDRNAGRGLWRFKSERSGEEKVWGFASSPAIGDERVFVGGLDGRVYAFRQD